MSKHGAELPQAKLTEAMVIDARCWAAEGILTTTEIIGRLGVAVSKTTMMWAINGRTWAYLNETFPPPPRRPRGSVRGRKRPGQTRSTRRLTDDQIRGIRAARASQVPMQAIADQYGVSRTLVNEIVYRRQYADVTDQEHP